MATHCHSTTIVTCVRGLVVVGSPKLRFLLEFCTAQWILRTYRSTVPDRPHRDSARSITVTVISMGSVLLPADRSSSRGHSSDPWTGRCVEQGESHWSSGGQQIPADPEI
eukprot:COSAG01_NODE_11345_length_1953_cov_43.618662_2_plen_110_part_00